MGRRSPCITHRHTPTPHPLTPHPQITDVAVHGDRALARIRHNLQPRILNISLPGVGGLPSWIKGLATFPFIVSAEFRFEVRRAVGDAVCQQVPCVSGWLTFDICASEETHPPPDSSPPQQRTPPAASASCAGWKTSPPTPSSTTCPLRRGCVVGGRGCSSLQALTRFTIH